MKGFADNKKQRSIVHRASHHHQSIPCGFRSTVDEVRLTLSLDNNTEHTKPRAMSLTHLSPAEIFVWQGL
jgi:hypothetical protein